MNAPDEAMLAPVRALAKFMATLDGAQLDGVFADDVVIVENFAPYVFRGIDAAARWREGFRLHAAALSGLVSAFGPPQDFSRDGDTVYFALPTTWTGSAKGRAFVEDGGWSFVLARSNDSWSIVAYAWAVTDFRSMEAGHG